MRKKLIETMLFGSMLVFGCCTAQAKEVPASATLGEMTVEEDDEKDEEFQKKVEEAKAKDGECDYLYTSDSTYVSIKKFSTDSYVYHLSHVLIKDVSQLKAGQSYDDYGGARQLTTEFAQEKNAVLAINGTYFLYEDGTPDHIDLVIKEGEVKREGATNGQEICLLDDGTFFSPVNGETAEDLLAMGVTDMFGTNDPLLIQDGVRVDAYEGIDDSSYNRNAIGVVAPGEYYIIDAGEGGHARGVSFKFLQDRFMELGCDYARSLDGGGSVTLVFQGALINSPADYGERAVPDYLYFTDYTGDSPEPAQTASVEINDKSFDINSYLESGITSIMLRNSQGKDWSDDITAGGDVDIDTGKPVDIKAVCEDGEEYVFCGIPVSDLSALNLYATDEGTSFSYYDNEKDTSVSTRGVSLSVFDRSFKVKPNVDSLNVRTEPTTSGDILKTVSSKDTLTVYGKAGDWYLVGYEDGYAYIHSNYATET